jgi:3'-phosphoadenosine 5'-phosphosulfate sulfotransferase (PAPS reductase)/FAD synthetase
MEFDFDFELQDRLQKIRSIDEMYNLRDNAFLSYSGGRDSCVLSALIDLALPGNRIPRVFFNTGIEYKALLRFVRKRAEEDSRIVIYNSGVNLRKMLEGKGYPFKSKEFAQKLATYQNSGMCKTVTDYLGTTGSKAKSFQCPDILKQCFTPGFTLKVSDKCCKELKKKVSERWGRENGRHIVITGMTKGEGGVRKSKTACTVFDEGVLRKFHPLFPVSRSFIGDMIGCYNIELCELYYPPYNFQRTGCKGCPFNMRLAEQLELMKTLLPDEYRQCNILWKRVYDEYRRLGYRLPRGEDEVSS